MSASLYLFPNSLGDNELNQILPAFNIELITGIRYFIVEDIRTARRFLKKCDQNINIDELTFFVLNQHTSQDEIAGFLNPLKQGFDMGLLSEAGCPAVADPGADVVALAQRADFNVIPLVGPSSVLLALMASGFNGQNFAFNGYLPIDPKDKQKLLKKLEFKIFHENQTQIFIETPYRNHKTLNEIIQFAHPALRLCIAMDLTLKSAFIKTRDIKSWMGNLPDMHKKPAIFLLYH